MSASAFTQITDYADRVLARLALQFANATNLKGILDALASEIQEAEEGLFDLQLTREFDSAEDVTLDKIGQLVGAPARGSKSNYLYQLRVGAQLLINRGSGDINTIYQVAEKIIPGWATAGATIEEYVGSFEISGTPIDGITEPTTQARELAATLRDVAGAGIRAIVMHRAESIGGGTAFRFAGGAGGATGFGVGKFRAAYDE